jgi:predicted acyl esterase
MPQEAPAPAYDVTFVRNLFIPRRDGTHLAADLHMPIGDGHLPCRL